MPPRAALLLKSRQRMQLLLRSWQQRWPVMACPMPHHLHSEHRPCRLSEVALCQPPLLQRGLVPRLEPPRQPARAQIPVH